MSDSHFPEFVDSQSMKTLEVAFYFNQNYKEIMLYL
jgi:hypothetical protein